MMKNNLFGFGCMRLPVLDENDNTSFDYDLIERMFDEYLARGYTYFDTAYVYHSYEGEKAIRKALVERYPRNAYELASKLPLRDFKDEEDMMRIFNEQLKNLGVDYLDYYLLHNMGHNVYRKCEDHQAFSFMVRLKKAKKIRHIGMSFHDTPELLEEILEKYGDKIDFVQLQINYADWDNPIIQAKNCLAVAKKYGKPVTVMETCKGGTLAKLPKEAEKIMKEYAPEASVASWAFRFALSRSGVARVLSGMNSLEQLEDNLNTIDSYEPLNDEELAIIEQVVDILNKNDAIACTGCGYCAMGCPMHIAIPQYFSLYNNLKKLSGSFSSHASYYNNIVLSGKGRANECLGCGQCEETCPQHLSIRDNLKKVSEAFDRNSFPTRKV